MFDQNGGQIGPSLGKIVGKRPEKEQTKYIDLNPGEVITGVKIQEVPFWADKGIPGGYTAQKR